MSDTVTKPTPGMLRSMLEAEVGDDVFGEDPTVNRLEGMVAKMFNQEAAVFCPSGTMTNQIAIQLHTQGLDEMICERRSHVYQFETGGFAYNARTSVNLIETQNGKLTLPDIQGVIKKEYDWLPHSALVVIENSCNAAGGIFYRLDEVRKISQFCRQSGIRLHLDGARLFNVLVETNEKAEAWGELFDSISICLSKGLGAPVGSLLISAEDRIKKARRLRKVMGGGMRQAGYLAAAGIYALERHIDRLKEDNQAAKMLGKKLEHQAYVENVYPVHTNIVIFDLKAPHTGDQFLSFLLENDIKAVAFGPSTIRFVTHLDVTPAMIRNVLNVLDRYEETITNH